MREAGTIDRPCIVFLNGKHYLVAYVAERKLAFSYSDYRKIFSDIIKHSKRLIQDVLQI